MRISPELEAKMIAAGATVRHANGSVVGGPDLSPPPADGCDEKAFQARVVDVATALGWERCYHAFDSRRSERGFMDLVLGCEWRSKPVLAAELKVPPNKPSAAQLYWLRVFEKAGIPTYLWYPSDWETIVAVLRRA